MAVGEQHTFKAEIQQLLNILVHSLYTDREVFLRELISNASDALSRLQFEQLTNSNILDADAPLEIRIRPDEAAGTLTISDTGIGMNQDELANNLGVIAHSGAKAFIEALQDRKDGPVKDLIGQFGVGFYSAFMVADRIRVVSRSFRPEDSAYAWESDGSETYTIEPAERDRRGTDIILHLKDDAREFLQGWKLKDIIRRHSDYIPYPIYVGDDSEATNKQTAIWRQEPKEVTDEQYTDFYKMMTLDFNEPLHRIHMRADVPLQFYALLYVPSSAEPNLIGLRREPGLKLYARKVLIQEYTTELLPEYLQFMQGVVDSEDLPLSVSRENIQTTRVIANLKKTLTNKVLSEFKRLAKNKRETYLKIYDKFGRFIKQGLAISPGDREDLEPLLFFRTTRSDEPISLAEYVQRMARNQKDIYYILGEDITSAARSPHLDAFRQRGIEVLYLTDPVDPIMLMGLREFDGHKLRNVDEADIDLRDIGETPKETAPQQREALPEDAFNALRQRFAEVLGDRVQEVRESRNLVDSPARLVSNESDPNRNMYRIQRLLDREYELPVRIMELNSRHPLLHNLSRMLSSAPRASVDMVIEQIFETALLQEGLHPDPASMATRLTLLMQAATGTPLEQLQPEPDGTPDKVEAAEAEEAKEKTS
ncbi:MAG: molecular chaperone HtpG [Chloroflexota bacterium]|nr:MAG: molecular chaperone HtpG [Chloroflexota bacterium]